MTAAPARPITAEEFLHMPESDGAELLDGQIVEKGRGLPTVCVAGSIAMRFAGRVESFGLAEAPSANHGMCGCAGAESQNRTLFVHSALRRREIPDLVFEVVSPNDKAEQLEQKLVDYREAGIPLIWVVYPGTRSAQVLTPTSRIDVLPSGVLDGGDVLPGFLLSLAELFAGLDAE